MMPSLEAITDQRASRALCLECRKRFERSDEFWINHRQPLYFSPHRYHIECYAKSKVKCQCLRQLISPLDFEKLSFDTKQRILAIFPEFVPWQQRPFLNLATPIDQMTMKELGLELRKRDQPRNGKKDNLAITLMQYEDDDFVRKSRSVYVVIGYCRRMEGQKHKMNIPIYLKQIVVDYFGMRKRQYEEEIRAFEDKWCFGSLWLTDPDHTCTFH